MLSLNLLEEEEETQQMLNWSQGHSGADSRLQEAWDLSIGIRAPSPIL